MKNSEKESKWRPEYSIAAILGVLYIFLLGLFTWIFNSTF